MTNNKYTLSELLQQVESKIGYVFKEKSFLITALTHSSYANQNKGCEDNEKLEFLGDALLNFICAKQLFEKCLSEGEMTKNRSSLVSRKPLKDAVMRLDLIKYVRFGNGAIHQALSEKAISDVFEAIVGAIYIDCGDISIVEKFISNHLKNIISERDFKSELQEKVQSQRKKVEYKTIDIGTVHSPYFSSEVILDGQVIGKGEGHTKKDAEKNSARQALSTLNEG